MDSTAVFTRAIKLVWQHKIFWLLGCLLGIATIAQHLFSLISGVGPADLAALTAETAPIADAALFTELLTRFTLLSVYLFIFLTAIWLIALVGEAGVIGAVDAIETGRSYSPGGLLRAGWGMVRRFLAIDALVFLPWFLLTLLLMLLVLGILVAGALPLWQGGGDPNNTLLIWSLGALCLLPFILVLPLVTALSFLYRALAFREAMLGDAAVRPALRRTWQLIRPHWTKILFLFLLLTGVRVAAGSVLAAGRWLLLGLEIWPWQNTAASFWQGVLWLVQLFFAGIDTAVTTYLLAVTAVAWTLAYRQLREERSGKPVAVD